MRMIVLPRRTITDIPAWDVCRREGHNLIRVATVWTSLADAEKIAETILLPLPAVPPRRTDATT